MPSQLTKNDLQIMAESKLADSGFLFANNRVSNAYYLGGYAIELALKACIAKQMEAGVIPDRQLILDTYTHEYMKLIGVAGLKFELNEKLNKDQGFSESWAIVQQWNPDARYRQTDKMIAQYFLSAISDPTHGVFTWIKSYW